MLMLEQALSSALATSRTIVLVILFFLGVQRPVGGCTSNWERQF